MNAPTCAFCGAAIVGRGYTRLGEGYCCEGCYLKQGEFQAMRLERDHAYAAVAQALVTALDIREHETGLHSQRVACHTQVLARRFTDDAEVLRQIYWGSLLHDVGKIGIPDAILLKEGGLSPDEWRIMRTHPEKGYGIVSQIPFLAAAAEVILAHEERFDGSGYPRGLKGEAIPWGARLFAVIDTLDAMTSDRPYRKGLSFDTAKEEIRRLSGSQFDPEAVAAFAAEETILRRMVEIKCTDASPSSANP